VTVCLPVLVTTAGLIRLLPICTLPNATFDAESNIWAVAVLEISNSDKRMGIQQAGLRGDLRHLISFALFLHVLVEHGGGICRALLLAADKLRPRHTYSSASIVSRETNYR
jgi:hypothetical protein